MGKSFPEKMYSEIISLHQSVPKIQYFFVEKNDQAARR